MKAADPSNTLTTVEFHHMKSRAKDFLGLAIALLVWSGLAMAEVLPTAELSAGIHRIEAEVAATQSARMTGLMNRKSMAANRGMLFVFEEAAGHCMWMRNTLIPLAVAFLDEQGRVINIEEMQALTEDNHCAARPARFALEMNAGWFKTRGIGPGTPISGIGGRR
jgi:uncharacterized membrane protein (UPF0127 family)